ncbi:MAG: hypothetical protein JJU11_14905, partial [Candidatus Sumerlaeia bacterium]|nr:hypothetical protein [Candidatus Sumerlaeia bacterium]
PPFAVGNLPRPAGSEGVACGCHGIAGAYFANLEGLTTKPDGILESYCRWEVKREVSALGMLGGIGRSVRNAVHPSEKTYPQKWNLSMTKQNSTKIRIGTTHGHLLRIGFSRIPIPTCEYIHRIRGNIQEIMSASIALNNGTNGASIADDT